MSGRSYVTTFKTKAETQGISEMQGKLRDLQKSLSETKREEKALTKEVTTAEKEIAKINKQIAKTGEATEEQKKDLERLSKTVKDGKDALEALKLKESQLQSQINDTNKKIEEERAALEKLKTSMADTKKYSTELVKEFGALGAAATAAVAGLFAFTKGSAQWADDLNTLSMQTGISTEELQKFAYASDIIDVSTETMTSSLTKLTRNMQSAAEGGTSAAAKAFQELGISITDASGQLRDRQEVFYEAIDALGRIENVTERDAVAMNIFGRSAQELNPLILGGAQTLKELGDEAERAGLILDQTTLNGLNDFNNKIDLLKAKGAQIKNFAASEMTPALDGLLDVANELLDEINKMAKSGELKKIAKEAGKIIKDGATALKNLISFVWKYKEAIGAAVTAMVAFKVALSIANLIQSLGNALKVLKGATDAATLAQQGLNTALTANPIGAVMALVSALTMGTIALVGALSNQTEELKNTTVEVKDYTEALRSTIAQEEKVMSAAEGEAGLLRTQQEEYDTLRQKTNLTAEEKRRLDDIASNLAATLGTTTEALKDQSGAYQDVSASVDEYIRNLQNKAKAEHLESIIKKSTAAMFDLEEPIENAKSKIAEIEGKIAEFAEETKKHDAEWNKAHKSEREQLKKTYKEAQQTYAQLETQRRDALLAQQKATEEYKKLPPVVDRAASSVEDYAENLKDLKSASTSLRSEMSSLASSYDQLNNGQSLSIDTILNLIDKYPEYTDLLIDAANDTDLQRAAVETLFEAKKNEYILTQQSAIDTIKASNQETDAIIRNINAQIDAINKRARALSLSTDDARQEKFYSKRVNRLNQILAERSDYVAENNEELSRLQRNIDFVQGLTVDSFKGGSSGSGSSRFTSGSGGSGSSGSDKALWEMNSKGVYASGDTYLKAYEGWIDRMKNLGKMSTQWEISLLSDLLKRSANTAEERYELEYRLYKAKEELAAKEAKAQEEAAKKQQERLLERQKLAKAAFDKLVNDRISAYEAEADAAKQSADAQIKAIDDVEAKRKRTQEREKREKELAVINAKLTYEHGMTSSQRYDLERRRQEILNEQYEANHQRAVEIRKANIQSRSDAVQSRTQQAIDGLNAAKSSLADRVAYLSGSQTYDQRVANNSKTVNIQLITNGLTEDQAANRIVQKVLKELG